LVSDERFRTLNNSGDRRRAFEDPDGWLAALPVGAVIDEAQLVRELQLGMKELIDLRGAGASQFLLTGSARFNTRELGGQTAYRPSAPFAPASV
jgi:predicted AAA+ superfamily ATPase